MELKDDEFRFESRVKGNGVVMWGRVDYCYNSKEWVANIEGSKHEGRGDCSHAAIIEVMKKFFDV